MGNSNKVQPTPTVTTTDDQKIQLKRGHTRLVTFTSRVSMPSEKKTRKTRFAITEDSFCIYCDECGVLSKAPPKKFWFYEEEKKYVCEKCHMIPAVKGVHRPFWLLTPEAVLENGKGISLETYQEKHPDHFEHLYFSHYFRFLSRDGMQFEDEIAREHLYVLEKYGTDGKKFSRIKTENYYLQKFYDSKYRSKYEKATDFIRAYRENKLQDPSINEYLATQIKHP